MRRNSTAVLAFAGAIIPPGTRKRLSKTEDLARFCRAEGELFEARE